MLVVFHNPSLMGCPVLNFHSFACPVCVIDLKLFRFHHIALRKDSIFRNHLCFRRQKPHHHCQILSFSSINESENVGFAVKETEIPRYKWVKKSSVLTKVQQEAISQVTPKMTNRCKALMKQIICHSPENGSVAVMLATWVKSTKPERADWLSILKDLDRLNHPLWLEVAEHALTEESFEVNIRDYTKIIHSYAKGNRIQEAEKTLADMKNKGFMCDQVILTALVHMYSKNGNLKLAEDSFEEMKLLGVPLDRMSYGSMIMAYIRAGELSHGETLLQEMQDQDVYAGIEVYKALLRAYSMMGDSRGAQRIFDAIQLAGIVPDAKICGLLINAYVESGQTREACIAFENLRRAGVEPNDKCVALVLAAYEKENRLKEALDLLMELERNSFLVGEEASHLLAKWFQKLGVVEEVELVLREVCQTGTGLRQDSRVSREETNELSHL